MSSILFTLQIARRFLPNIEPISILIVLYTIIFKRRTIYIIYVFVLLEGLFYGFGLWWINYLYVWLVLYLIAHLFYKIRSPFYWALINGGYGLSFGALCSIPYLFMGGLPAAFGYWISGLQFDVVHGIANFVLALFLFKPLFIILDNIYTQYGNL